MWGGQIHKANYFVLWFLAKYMPTHAPLRISPSFRLFTQLFPVFQHNLWRSKRKNQKNPSKSVTEIMQKYFSLVVSRKTPRVCVCWQ